MLSGKLESWPAPPLEWIGHTDMIGCIRCSPHGSHIVTGCDDMTIRIWDAETGTVVGEALKGHTGMVESVNYSPDGQHIISGSRDKTIRIWDAGTGAAVGKPSLRKAYVVIFTTCCGVFDAVKITTSCGVFY